MEVETILKLARACNETTGPHYLAPAFLFFGVVPRMPIHPDDFPAQKERMNAMYISHQLMTEIMTRDPLKPIANSQFSGAADIDTKIGDFVLVSGATRADGSVLKRSSTFISRFLKSTMEID